MKVMISKYFVIIVRIVSLFILIIIFFAFIYGLMTLIGGLIPVNPGREIPLEGKHIYLVNNGNHIALALPRDRCPYVEIFDSPLNLSGRGGYFYFGWGDRQFYPGTPTVSNIDWSMAIRALFLPSPAVLEVLYLSRIIPDRPGNTRVIVTEKEIMDLYKYIKDSIMDSNGLPEQISSDDVDQSFRGSIFFEAKGSYSLFNTCNNWTSKGLKQSGINTHLWTPFTWGVK